MALRLGKVLSQLENTASRPNIHLYTAPTPNGIKISITLEELGLPYEFTRVEISKNVQKEPWFLAINPNGRIPALTDTFSDGKSINLFESGSIQQYLIDEYDTDCKISYPRGTREYYEVNNWVSACYFPCSVSCCDMIKEGMTLRWLSEDHRRGGRSVKFSHTDLEQLFFLNSGIGPMQGQANHFHRYAPEKIEYGINRYQIETRRLYKVIDDHLETTKNSYLVGDKCTIADIAHFGWIVCDFQAPTGPIVSVHSNPLPF
jgi:glutathione S-transferase